MKKYCTKCGHEFDAVGREVICPSCKAAAEADAKHAAVLKAKRASWAGESVPVRISGRASAVIRECGKVHDLPFAAALDELLKASEFFTTMGKAWEEVEPYRSRRRDKTTATSTDVPQEVPQDVKQDEPVKQAAKPVKQASKATKTAGKAASKATSSKTAGKAASKQ